MNLNPEHIHVVVNHIPLIGLGCALLLLLIGLVGRRKESLTIGLLLAALCGGATPVVMWSGEEAEHEWLHSESAAHLGAEGHAWAKEHEERAETGVWVIYAATVLSVLSLATMRIKKLKKVFWTLTVLTTLGCAASIATAAWIADSGGKISHPEFRTGPAPLHDEDGHDDH